MRIDGSRGILNPGLCRHQGRIEQKVVTGQNASGEDIYTWALVNDLYFNLQALQGNEALRVQQMWAEARYKVTCQHIAGIERTMRLVWWDGSSNRTLEILDVQDLAGTRAVLVMYCREWVE